MSDPYATLGVNRSSSDAEIKSAYRRLAKQHHPDAGGDQKRFAEISSAYDSIKDSQSRQNFDKGPSNFQQSQSPFEMNFGANFQDMFDQMFGKGQQRTMRQTQANVHVSLQDFYDAQPVLVNISAGHSQKAVQLAIPKGIAPGEQVRYQGMAPDGGDLMVRYTIKEDPKYTLDEFNVHQSVEVPLHTAIFGGEKVIETLDRKQIKLHIKSGTQSGTKLRIPEGGLARRNLPNADMIIEIKVRIPRLELDKETELSNIIQRL
mgnify:CR=1 FL=1